MAFGLSAGAAALVGSVAAPVIGGLMGGRGNSSTQTSQASIDPRMADAVYGSGGILPSGRDWYNANKTGMNAQMATGLDNQWNQHTASTQGFNQMQNLGMGLMGGGTAGNPFTGGGYIAPSQPSYAPAAFTGGTSNGQFAQANTAMGQTFADMQAKQEADAKAAAEQAARLAALQQGQTAWDGGGGNGGRGFGGGDFGAGNVGRSGSVGGYGGDSSHGTAGY
jgi:hypothetical protein